MQHETSKFQKYIYALLTWCYVLYDTQMNLIITTQIPKIDLFVDVSI